MLALLITIVLYLPFVQSTPPVDWDQLALDTGFWSHAPEVRHNQQGYTLEIEFEDNSVKTLFIDQDNLTKWRQGEEFEYFLASSMRGE